MAGFLRENITVACGDELMHSIEQEAILPESYEYRNQHCLVLPGMLEFFDYGELL